MESSQVLVKDPFKQWYVMLVKLNACVTGDHAMYLNTINFFSL